ncbi:GTP 3',8-cyclase MoaA [Parachitinimonas caeni]|uniref:GTP 3',8-cyclase n=1 Tax=Parachitinimonas caeni TaxID=3031301 RepID=A0ABT7DSP3_9NEIS|nr:GTP 3',8-cyclase MoaA [Parachitinimonas caeni]MDK2123080.1 GTP 3',8-cyclase MoaA [Parachitinimonas caeni]
MPPLSQPISTANTAHSALIDRFGRKIDYLRLSVTDRCDLRCSYCLPKGFKGFEEPADWLTFDEISRVVAAFGRLGLRRVRLTGGEPLLRRNLPELAKRLAALPGIDDLSLSTNATQLDRQADALKAAGIRRINVSLDSLDPRCVQSITGNDSLDRIMAGLAAGKAAGFDPIKLNMVVMPGINDGEIQRMVQFALDHGFVLRLIEPMPVGDTGRQAGRIDLSQIGQQLARTFGLTPLVAELGGGPARYLADASGQAVVGLITPLSQHFCASCNRLRMTVDGTLHLCLGQEASLPLRPLLREGISDIGLEAAIRQAIELKPERHEFRESPHKVVRFMSQTGG